MKEEMLDMFNRVFVPIHRAGWPFIALFAGLSLLLAWITEPLGWLGFVLTLWCIYFFRDPDRVTPDVPGLVISPCDGMVQSITQAAPPPELDMGDKAMVRISVFMNVFDVHVNRIPIDGTVIKSHYHPGKFLNASLDKSSIDNERQSCRLATSIGPDIAFVQIAGLIARRIISDLEEGHQVICGKRFGLIRFGSRLDVYLPRNIKPHVIEGQRVLAGETVLANLKGRQSKRSGTVH